ncbi:hypothetical protein D1224_04600 [Henriciella barbarensis]|uniref:Uncharacterized protein n=1 Tax=Henriciella barbarensis TaxID=86342 RepID=A0A399QX97_9PROT|nr:hypothetical protein [Henriciella barbarensis]RIJ23548.1 hypothetical protein D1224_04600 [Henriciella barbarensis]
MIAVLTGDLINSTSHNREDVDYQFKLIQRAFVQVGEWGDQSASDVERFRGDGWQVALSRPKHCLRAALLVRATLRSVNTKFDSRVSVGIGHSEYLNFNDLAASTGSAFIVSGRKLEKMRKSKTQFAFGHFGREGADANLAAAIFYLCDSLCDRWTSKQSEIMVHFLNLDNKNQSKIGDILEISQQVVSKQIAASGGFAISEAIDSFEEWID